MSPVVLSKCLLNNMNDEIFISSLFGRVHASWVQALRFWDGPGLLALYLRPYISGHRFSGFWFLRALGPLYLRAFGLEHFFGGGTSLTQREKESILRLLANQASGVTSVVLAKGQLTHFLRLRAVSQRKVEATYIIRLSFFCTELENAFILSLSA